MKETRWQQRFENFEKALILLREALKEKSTHELSSLEKEGLVQRFEYTFELAWKTLKDYLEHSGIVLDQITPRAVIKQAFTSKILREGQEWIEMLDYRNLMSHTYNQETFEKAVNIITEKYFNLLDKLYLFIKQKDTLS